MANNKEWRMTAKIRCSKHKKYRGINEPKTCKICWLIYLQEHPDKYPIFKKEEPKIPDPGPRWTGPEEWNK